jgi:exonuclease-1
MGITGLLPRLRGITTEINIQRFSGQVAEVDTYCLLHKVAVLCAEELV